MADSTTSAHLIFAEASSSTNPHPRHPYLLTLAQIAEAMESPPQPPAMLFRAQTNFFGPPSAQSVSHLNQNPNLNLSLGESSSFSSGQPRDQTYVATYQYLQRFGQQSTIPQPSVYPPEFTRPFSSLNASQVRPPSTPSCAVVLNSFGQPVLESNSAFRTYLNPSKQNTRYPQLASISLPIGHRQNPQPYDNLRYDPNLPRYGPNSTPPNLQPTKRSRIEEPMMEDVQESTDNTATPAQKSTDQTKKGKEKVGNFSQTHLSRLELFSCHEACARFESFKHKIGQTTKGFQHLVLLKYPQFVHQIEKLGWKSLCEVPRLYNVDWVRDFYTELSVTNGIKIKVRQTTVCFSAEIINELLGLEYTSDESEFIRLTDNATEADFEAILKRIAHTGSEWSFKAQTRLLSTHCLLPEANVWFFFLRHTLYPTAHETTICMVRVFILYCIMEGQNFNVGRLISNNIFSGAERSNKRMPHPSIIHSLMERANAPILTSNHFSTDKMVMDKMNVERLLRNNTYFHPKRDNDVIISLETNFRSLQKDLTSQLRKQRLFIKKQITGLSEEVSEKLDIIIAYLRRTHDENVRWLTYEKSRDDLIRIIWSQEHPDLLRQLPPFPQDLLWMTPVRHPTQNE